MRTDAEWAKVLINAVTGEVRTRLWALSGGKFSQGNRLSDGNSETFHAPASYP